MGSLAGNLLWEPEFSVRETSHWAVQLEPCTKPALTHAVIITIIFRSELGGFFALH